MGKTVAYVAAAVVFLGIGALVAGLCIWYYHPNLTPPMTTESRYARCVLQSTGKGGDVQGTLYLKQLTPTSVVHITGTITGMTEGLHGFHVHKYGVAGAEDGCKPAAGHYNPMGYKHAGPTAKQRHVGDLGNIGKVDGDYSKISNTTVDIKDNIVTLSGEYSIAGRAIVVHEKRDDLGLGNNAESTKTGNAGARLACCTIYLTEKLS